MSKTFVDFEKLRLEISATAIASILNLKIRPSGKNYRGTCPFPACGNPDGLFINQGDDPEKRGLWYAHCCRVGGDLVGLYAKVKGIKNHEAATELKKHMGLAPDTRPDVRVDKDEMKPLEYLIHDHEACRSFELSADTCKLWGIGYAPKGTLIGCVAVPIHVAGKLIGYVGYKKGEPLKKGKSIEPGVLFNVDGATNEEPLHVAMDPIAAIDALTHGVPNVVSYLGEEDIDSAAQLVLLMRDKGVTKYVTI